MRRLAFTLGGAGLTIAATSAAATLGNRSPAISAYGTASPGLAVISSLTGVALFATAAVLAAEGAQARAALATFFVGATWSADLWSGWSGAPVLLRNAGMLLEPMLAAAALFATASVLGRPRAARLSMVAAVAAIGASVAVWLARDPFLDRYCWRDCLAHSLAPFHDAQFARTATHVSLTLEAICGGTAAVLSARSLRVRPTRWASLAGIATGCALLASDAALRFEPSGKPDQSLFAELFIARGLALLALAVALGQIALRPRLVRHAIWRLASSGDGLAPAFGGALGRAELRVGYPIAAGGLIVDAEGHPITLEGVPARIVRDGEVIALVAAVSGAPNANALENALGPAARLALANERLQATQLFRLRELTELRRRIVDAGDATRHALERDLHDGAQQRLLALAIDLRVAVKHADLDGRRDIAQLLVEAMDRIAEATEELRSLAHGIFPATLASAGLPAALETLADTRPLVLSIALDSSRRFPREIEAAAYTFVLDATAATLHPVRIRVEERPVGLVLTIDDAPPIGTSLPAEERIGATGGTVTLTGRKLEAVIPMPAPL